MLPASFRSETVSDSGIGRPAFIEIGFVRVSIQAGFEGNADGAVETLRALKDRSRLPFDLLMDPLGADRLPSWVRGAKQATDGHLLELTREHATQFATLDKGIPKCFLIS